LKIWQIKKNKLCRSCQGNMVYNVLLTDTWSGGVIGKSHEADFLYFIAQVPSAISCMIKHSSALQTPSYLLPLQSWHFNNSHHGWNKKSLGAYYFTLVNSLPSTYFNGQDFFCLWKLRTNNILWGTYLLFLPLIRWVGAPNSF
jgi:hypothetical protein